MPKIRVAVLRGGPSHGYESSLATGASVLSLLGAMPEKYEPLDIFISRDGAWHYKGVVHKPEEVLWHTHLAWNALHGHYGEDGQVHQILDSFGVPYTGSQKSQSYLALNKELAKSLFKGTGLHTPQHELLRRDELEESQLINIFRNYLHPVVVKPATGTSWIAVRPVYTYPELKEAVTHAFSYSPNVLVEEFIRGKTASCAVVEHARGEHLHALMPVEIGENEDLCPGTFSTEENRRLEECAKHAHEALGMRHYSVSDFVVTKSGKIYILETNSSPELHENSVVHKSLGATGWKPHHFLDHIIDLVLKR